MTIAAGGTVSFFVAGGTLAVEASSYVERSADRDLQAALLDAKFCFVLNARQMGKSSLCVRTMSRLESQGVRTAFVDLTKIGGKNVNAEQWYAGIAAEIGRSIGLRSEVLTYWRQNIHLSPLQRLFDSLREVALERIEGPLCILIDEIDATRGLSFDADEFFAAIRECYNRRVQDGAFNRLTFCLFGVAIPSDLINNPLCTPFNIGERIYLRDFTLDEAMILAEGMANPERPLATAQQLLRRIYHWTNGHPYLTQSLCAAVASEPTIRTAEQIDALIRRDLFQPKARETNINLADVANRALHAGDLEPNPEKFRADLLTTYSKAWTGKPIPNDESNRVSALLKLSGLMREEGASLFVRNRIYRQVFDRTWIRENMPGQELWRQRRAFLLGVLRTAVVSAAVVALVSKMAWNNAILAESANDQRGRADYEAYAADMSLLDSLWQMGDLDQIQRILDKTATNPNRGWEWSFYDRLGHLDVGNRVYAGGIPSGDALHTPHGDLYGINTDSSVNIFDVATLKLIHSFPKVSMAPGTFMWSKDGKSFTETSMDGIVAQRDSSTGAVLRTRNLGFPTNFGVSCQARQITVLPDMTGQAWEIGSDMRAHRLDNVPRSSSGQFSDSGKWFVAYGGGLIEVFETNSWKIVKKFKIAGLASAAAIDPQDRWLAVDTEHSVTLFDFSSGKVLSRLAADGGGIAIFSKDDKALAIGSQGRRISVYDCGPVLKLNKIIVGPPWPTFFPSRNRLIGGYRFSKLFDIDSYADIEQRSMGTAPSPTQYTESSGQIYPDGEAACVGAESTGFIELANGEPAKVTPEKRPAVLCSVRPWIIKREETGVVVREIKTDRVICRLPSFPTAATVSQDGRYLVLLGSKTATVWNVEEGKEATSYKTEAGGDCISLSHDLSKIAVGYAYGSVDLIDQSTGAVVHARPHTYAVLKVRFSPDDLILATASMDDTAAFLDSSSLAVKRRFVGHSETVYDVDFSPDEKRIATTSDDGTVKVWDPTTGRDLMTFRPGTTSVKAVAWLDQGNTLASMDYQGTLRVLFTKASSPELVRIGARPGL